MRGAVPVRPLHGPGPWSLVDVADALGMSYDTVCRDVRHGLLPARRVSHAHAGRYEVSREDLLRSPLPRYHALARLPEIPTTPAAGSEL